MSIATAYRYLHEAIDVIAAHAPDLPEVLAAGLEEGWAFVCLDGTLIGVYPLQRTLAGRARHLVLRQAQTARREHPGRLRSGRLSRVGQRG